MKDYTINIIGLSNNRHAFRFEVNDSFFERHGRQIVESGEFGVDLVLDKHATFIDVFFQISGTARFVCDRTLEPFDEALSLRNKVIFKLGDENRELTDEMVEIAHDTAQLHLAQYIYEFICLAAPMKKIHPRFRDEENESAAAGRMVYQTAPASEMKKDSETEKIDPRWEKLKHIKLN